MDSNYEVLLNEKNDLEKALSLVEEELVKTKVEKEQIHKLFQDVKHHFEVIKSQSSQY